MEHNPELQYRIDGGFAVFGILAFVGLRLIYRGLRNDISDSSGTSVAGRSWFIAGGTGCCLPLIGYTLFLWKQGYFGP